MRCTAGLSCFLEPGMEFTFVPPKIDCPRRARITAVEQVHDMTASVTFDTFSTMQQTQDMVGAHCLMLDANFAHTAVDDPALQCRGMLVIDETLGELGFVTDVIVNPVQTLLVVDCSLLDKGDVMIPWVEEFVTNIDASNHVISVSIPLGLLEL